MATESPVDAAAVTGVGVAIALTCAVLGVTTWRLRQGQGRIEPVDALVGLTVLVWGSVLSTAGAVVLLGGGLDDAETPPLLAAVAGTAVAGLAAAGFAVARCSRRQLGLDVLAIRWCAGALVLVPAFLVIGAVWVWLLRAIGFDVEQQALLDVAGAGGLGPGEWVALTYGALGAPLLEELVFRGLVQSSLVRPIGAKAAAVGAGVLFGLMHLSEPAAVGPLVVMGVTLGLLRLRSRSLAPALVLHVGNNALALGLALAGVVGA